MDIISAITPPDLSSYYNSATSNISELANRYAVNESEENENGNLFASILDSAINNVSATNDLLTDAEAAEISFALGENTSTHDLVIAMQKASTSLQYTVAVRDKMLEAYNTIMQIQI